MTEVLPSIEEATETPLPEEDLVWDFTEAAVRAGKM